MTGGQHQPTTRCVWTKEQEDYLKQRRRAGVKIKDIAAEMGLSHQQVENKLYAQKKPRASRAEPRKPPANATQWAGGAYWRQPPARTWHKGITGRLIHLSATRDDSEDDDAKEAQ
jgi:hypothetical protein